MLFEELRQEVYQANLTLPELGLVSFTWGNVSAIDRESGLFVIKPSGISYQDLRPEYLVVVDLQGRVAEGNFQPSMDTATHAYLYSHFPDIGGIAHTHSPWAVAFASAGLAVPAISTTHADTFYGDVPCVPAIENADMVADYELQTGQAIVEYFSAHNLDPTAIPAALVGQHGPFTWGAKAEEAVYNAKVLETAAEIAHHSLQLTHGPLNVPQSLLNKHYQRKHGPNAYYGQELES
ncbi:L-ribulose-5-phosphate 4-epimerase AraD [Fructobacillus ficulneus]|uniref:L-ribulose-5-phosphate 4-epimerase n=1 Tax=Fructobacillus ficulneus TaxID=157463 RepID=A0A0K8MJB2_9LACO|nr:L-ribulose-5-phosphate 4-epimerase AraD [Fructobacillus ficulneus]GAP00279.1 L-ribulose-5-phosphate 4-epimerase [Fructobacillus ficulneus]